MNDFFNFQNIDKLLQELSFREILVPIFSYVIFLVIPATEI